MFAPVCATEVAVPRIPAHVVIAGPGYRGPPAPPAPPALAARARKPPYPVKPERGHGRRSRGRTILVAGDRITVTRPGRLRFSYGGNSYAIGHGELRLECANVLLGVGPTATRVTVLAVVLRSGKIDVRAGLGARRALVMTPEMLAYATVPQTRFVVTRNPGASSTQARTLDNLIVAANASDQALQVNTRVTYTAIADARGLRLDVWPFPISPLQRRSAAADALPPYWADGLPCSVGCTAPGAIPGWPLKPFHQQHAIRAGINELRPATFHVAVDIEATNFQDVYALQSGVAHIRYPGTGDINVNVGSFYYWHIKPSVTDGQYVTAYSTVLGHVLYGFYHLALSEGSPSAYLNPLRPGGSVSPYTDTEPPIIGTPRVFPDGRVVVGAFDPQSFVVKGQTETPVLAPSSLAWRLYDPGGTPLTGLEWAMRGSHNLPSSWKRTIFAPGASNPGFNCFFERTRCIPNWVYWLAGGLTPPLPVSTLLPGSYRLAVYAWDWAGNTSALDYPLTIPLAGAATAAEFGPLAPSWDYP
ncbi:MAG: hypothetical protein ACYDHH_18260 [Solirubrobacteraceae bacterium]